MKRVGVLRGGKGKNYNSSLRRGGEVLSRIFENLGDKYKTVDILIDKAGVWHINGIPVKPVDLMHKVDIVWNTADPHFSAIVREFGVPVISAPLHFDGILDGLVRAPQRIFYPASPEQVFRKFGAPWVVKGSGGTQIAKTFADLARLFELGVSEVEEFITGPAGAVHSIPLFRGQDLYIIPPANMSAKEKEKLSALVKDLHKHLGVEHYLKSDFIIHPKRGAFLTALEFHPDLRPGSHLATSLHSVGAKLEHLVEHILERATH